MKQFRRIFTRTCYPSIKTMLSCYRLINLLHIRYIIYAIILCATLYTAGMLYVTRSGLYIQCSCSYETKTQERVARYMPDLLKEKYSETNRFVDEEAELDHQSLPVKFLSHIEANGKRCDLLPGLFDIKHRNIFWQEAQIGTSMFLLFSAFLDYRDTLEGPLVRILAMADSAWPPVPTCHLYFSDDANQAPLATKAIRVDFLNWQYPQEGEWHPYIITCRAGVRDKPPKVVSLVSHPCSLPTNALRLINKDPKEKEIKLALCHKYLYNPAQDYSFRLIEWLEVARALGIADVTMYVTEVHPNVQKVLNYYEHSGYLTLLHWTNPGHQLNVPSLHRLLYDTQSRYAHFANENIPYTDCLLRHIDTHQYVGVWDMDEFVFPIQETSIVDIVEDAYNSWNENPSRNRNPKSPTSYLARSSYFFDDNVNVRYLNDELREMLAKPTYNLLFPDSTVNITNFQTYFHMLSHTHRTMKFTPPKVYTKSIHDTSRALGLHSHYALYNIEGRVDEKDLYDLYPQNEAFLAHFRNKCQGEDQKDCKENFRPFLTVDTSLWNYADDIISNSLTVMQEMELIE